MKTKTTQQLMQFPILILIFLILGSCEKETFDALQNSDASSNSEVKSLVTDFYTKMYSKKTRSDKMPKIVNVESKTYKFASNTANQTRSEEDSISFDMQTVELDFGDTKGYAMLSTDKRLNHVFYFSDNGCISDTTTIEPLKHLINAYPSVALSYIQDELAEQQNASDERFEIVKPFVKYKWHQRSPFNLYATYCTCSSCSKLGNHRPIGCIPIAVAQAIATIGEFKGHYYGTKDIDFNSLPAKGADMNHEQQVTVGRFLGEIALGCNTQFTCSGGGTKLECAYHFLKEMGYDVEFRSAQLIPEWAIENMHNGIPHIIVGYDENGIGHAWILHGVSIQNSKFSYWCNWGGGGMSDGWSDGTPYTSEFGTLNYPYHISNLYINSKSVK